MSSAALNCRRREIHLCILAALHDSEDFDVLARHAEQGAAWEQALNYLREAGRVSAQLGGTEAIALRLDDDQLGAESRRDCLRLREGEGAATGADPEGHEAPEPWPLTAQPPRSRA